MKITILNSSSEHPVNDSLKIWIKKHQANHEIKLIRFKKNLVGGDILFLISSSEIISMNERAKFKKSLLLHASDLPKGRGWSPHVWEILNNANQIVVSLLEVEDKFDTGDIWKKIKIDVPKTALYDDINQLIFKAEIELMDFALENIYNIHPSKQPTIEPSYWPKRNPKDSQIDIHKSIDEQFNLIRISDPKRFPSFFYKNGKKFKLIIELMDE
tara:strand:- start:5765 stop:6406 length:642 start_codon:yes stop_codon:yes gene_type:complete